MGSRSGGTPTAEARFASGSASIKRTRRPSARKASPQMAVTVVLPTPPLPVIAIFMGGPGSYFQMVHSAEAAMPCSHKPS